MNARIQHILIVVLFAAAHLIVQPLVSTGWCMGVMGEECCCISVAPDEAVSGCCGEPIGSSDSNDAPSDSENDGSGCDCSVTQPTPPAPEQTQPTSIELGEGYAALNADVNPLYSNVWSSLAVRAARPPNQPPRVARRALPAFTQVFRL